MDKAISDIELLISFIFSLQLSRIYFYRAIPIHPKKKKKKKNFWIQEKNVP